MATTSTRPSPPSSSFSSCDVRPVPMQRYQTKPVGEWSKKEVKAWLAALDLKQYARTFRKHDMCGSRLVGLSRDDLRAMNVTKVGHVKKITSWLRDSAALHNGYAPPPTAISPTLSPTTSSSSVMTSSGKFMATITRRYSFGGIGDSPVPPPLLASPSSSVVGATLVQSMARLAPASRHTSSTLSTTSSSSSSPPPSPTRRTKAAHSSSSTNGSPLRQSSMDIVCRREARSASVPENLHSQQFFDLTVSDDANTMFYSPETSGESLSLGSESAVPLPRRGGGSGIRGRPTVRKSNSAPDCNSSYARLYPSVYLWVKLVFDDDISILRFKRRTLTVKRLQREINRIHQCQPRLRWIDSDGDCIEIKTTEFLNYALEDWQRRFDEGQQRMIRIEAFQKA